MINLKQPSGKIFFTQRGGKIRFKQSTGFITLKQGTVEFVPPIIFNLDFTKDFNSQYINVIF